MKGKFSLPALLLALLVFGCCHSCSEKREAETTLRDRLSGFPLDEIKRSFNRDYAAAPVTRIGSRMDSTDIMAPGFIRPNWDSVKVFERDELFQATTAFDAEYDYCVLRWDATDSLLYPMPKRLVVLKDPESGKTASYLRFLIPDTGNTVPDDGADFTGFLLYTSLTGEPVTIGRYDAGELSDSLSVFYPIETNAASAERMVDRMDDVFVARVTSTNNPQDQNQPKDPSYPIDPVTIIGKRDPKIIYVNVRFLINKIIEFGGSNPPGIQPPIGDIYIDVGNGGGSGGSGNGDGGSGGLPVADKTFWVNPKIKFDREEVRLVLDSLNRDCMGQLLIHSIQSKVSITSGYFGSSSVSRDIVGDFNIQMGYRLDPVSMMEELMHVYQGVGTPAFRQAAMNYEVEAKLAWYMYCRRNGYNKELGTALGKGAEKYYRSMGEYIMQNDLNNPGFIEAFDNAVGALRFIGGYKNEERYPYDPGKMDCEKLMELMKDCINK